MSEKEYYITKEKREDLEEELEYLTTEKRKEIADTLEHARSRGDLSENAEYHEARQQQAELEERIREIKYILKNAEIVSHRKSDTIQIGSTVELRKKHHSKTQDFQIVGSEESDMLEGRISYTSPLGKALLGKKPGDSVTFEAPGGEVTYHVENVE